MDMHWTIIEMSHCFGYLLDYLSFAPLSRCIVLGYLAENSPNQDHVLQVVQRLFQCVRCSQHVLSGLPYLNCLITYVFFFIPQCLIIIKPQHISLLKYCSKTWTEFCEKWPVLALRKLNTCSSE